MSTAAGLPLRLIHLKTMWVWNFVLRSIQFIFATAALTVRPRPLRSGNWDFYALLASRL